jgi:hypothetical protein
MSNYPAGVHNVPAALGAGALWYLHANGATGQGQTVFLNPGYGGPTASDGWAGAAICWTLARVLHRMAGPPTNPNWGPDPLLYNN